MQDLINLIVNNGIGVVCVAYLIYFQHTTLREMIKTLNSIDIRIAIIEEFVSQRKEEINETKQRRSKKEN